MRSNSFYPDTNPLSLERLKSEEPRVSFIIVKIQEPQKKFSFISCSDTINEVLIDAVCSFL